jgi:2-dehydropantoate 2-reductase
VVPCRSFVVGELDGRLTERVGRIAAALREAGVDARASDHIQVELWQKFVFIAALAAACGLARSPVGPLRTGRLGRRLLDRAIAEVVAVARARGIPLPDDEATRVSRLIDGLPAAMKPSFLVDLESGGPTELDILSGAVSRFADEARITTPIHDTATVALDSPPPRQGRGL